MSLYGDLPQAKNSSGGSMGWASSALKPILRKPSGFTAPPSVLRAGRGGSRTPIVGGRGGGRTPINTNTEHTPDAAGPSPSVPGQTSSSIFNIGIKDEYDPMRPNDYEAIVAEREKKKKEAEAEAERQARLKEMEEEGSGHSEDDEDAPPSMGSTHDREARLQLSGEEAFLRRARMAAGGGGAAIPPPGFADSDAAAKGMTLAQKMLEKMGWKEGEGLGRNKQGMSTPLVAQKIGKRSGVIENAQQLPTRPKFDFMPPPPDKKPRGTLIQGQPSRVVCLRNMVGPREVDEELEEEVGNELLKYGQVEGVLIFEVTSAGFHPEEAVRIFCKFDRTEAAMKALVDLQGRFFNGRMVRAAFFSEARFDNDDLAPQPGEFD